MKKLTCQQRINQEWTNLRKDLAKIVKKGDYEELNHYALCLDLIEAGTYEDQREDYIRLQFSYGGPSDELRFYKNGDIEYWFLDWFDGASINVSGDKVAQAIRDYCLSVVDFPKA